MTALSSLEPLATLEMKPREFERIRQMAHNFCGVDLKGKQILVSARLGKKIRSMNLDTFTSYCDHVESDLSGSLFAEMIDALTTNHTSFFREVRHFDFLRDIILPQVVGQDAIRIWSAACSTGEEPYTIAFSIVDAIGRAAYAKLSITATDISTRVLERAKTGLYPLEAVSSLTTEMRRECLMKGTGTYQGQCLVKPEIKRLIEFHRWNLLESGTSFGPFDVVFCRNVMIYFDQQTQQTVVDNLVSRLIPGGYFFIGHAESLNGINHSLEYICSATYRKPIMSSQLNNREGTAYRLGAR